MTNWLHDWWGALFLAVVFFANGYVFRWGTSPVRYKLWRVGPDETVYKTVEVASGVCASCAKTLHADPPYGITVEVWNAYGQQLARRLAWDGTLINDVQRARLFHEVGLAVDNFERWRDHDRARA